MVKKEQKPIIIAILIVVLVIGGIFILVNLPTNYTGNVINNREDNQQNCREEQMPYKTEEEYLKTEYYIETVPYIEEECETEELAYSIDNFVRSYNTCNEYEDICIKYFLGICTEKKTFCVDKSVSCSLNLRNLDNEEQGSWTIKFLFFEEGTSKDIDSDEISVFLYPQTSKTITGRTRIESEGEEGDANKEITCNYHRINLPTKKICEEITRYKEIQREKQITAYRPVTKYKTETICD